MAYAILGGTDEEIRERYSYIRQFIKESKKFGAQRRASEKLAGEVDPEMSHSTIEMRRAVAEFTCKSFKLKNVTFTDSHAIIKGTRANHTVHLGSGIIHLEGGLMINVLPVHSQKRGRIFLPFVDDDPKTAEVISKILLFAEDNKIKDPFILNQIV